MQKLIILLLMLLSFSIAEDLKKVSLQLKWKYQFQFAGFIVAKEKGFYKDLGLDVELKEFNGKSNIVKDVLTRKSDFGISDSALVYNALQNEPVSAMMAVFQQSPFILVGLQNNIVTLNELNNKTIALHEGIDGISIKAMLKTKDIKYKLHDPVFSLDKLISKEIDMMSAYISNEPYLATLMDLDLKIFSPKDYGFEGYGDILFTSKEMLKTNPEIVKRFYEATMRGWAYAYSNIDEVVDLIYHSYNSIDKTKQALRYEAYTLKTLSGYKDNFGKLNIEKIKSIAQQFNLIKNEHNKLDRLDDFIYPENQIKNQIIEQQKKVNIMLGFDKPPFIFGQSSAKGIEADLLKEAFDLVNYKVNILQGKKSEQEIVLHQENEIDGVATISKQNNGLFYSDDFTIYENFVITRKSDNITLDSLDDLKNIDFVTWKTAYNDLGDEFYKLFNPMDGKYKSSYHDTSTQINDAKMFFSKKVDAIIVDKKVFNWHKLYFKKTDEYTFHKIFKTQKVYPVTFRDKSVRDDFNRGLKILKKTGRYNEIIKFYETQDIKELMRLTNLLSDISGKYIFDQKKDQLIEILKQFFLHPDIKIISIKNKHRNFLNLVKRGNDIHIEYFFDDKNLQKITNKIYHKTEYDLLNMGELSVYYKKDYQTKNGIVIPSLSKLTNLNNNGYDLISQLYIKYKIENDFSIDLTQKERDYLNKHKKIIVHNENNWAPYNYNENGIAKGFSIEYMELLAKKLHLEIEYKQGYSWSEYLEFMKKEEIDIIVNIVKNKQRDKYFSFTSPYIHSKKAIFSNIKNIKDISDLKGKTVALPDQFYTQNYLLEHYPSINIKTYKNTKDALYAVINKDADAIIENFAVIDSLMKKNGLQVPYVTLNDNDELKSSLRIGVNKNKSILRDILEKAKKSVTDEEFFRLESKWFGIEINDSNLFNKKELDYIKKRKIINVCFHQEQHPWVIKTKNSISGSSIEFLKYITKKSNLKFNFVESSTVIDHFNKIKSGTCDISPIIVTKPNRFKFLNPTVSMIEDNIVLVTKVDEPYISDLENLGDKKIAIHKGKKNLIKYVRLHYPKINLVEIDDLDLERVISGEFYGYISASYKMSYKIYPNYVKQLKIMTKIGDQKIKGSFGITTREPLLLSIFNKSLNNISQLERQEIENAWVSVEVEKQFDYILLIQIIVVFSLILIILAVANIKQKRLHIEIRKLNESLEESVKTEVQKNRDKDKLMLSQSRLAQMGEVISMIAHQWRQPLNSLSLLNQTILLKYDRNKLNDEAIDFFRTNSKKQIHEMSKTIDDFKDFFKPQKIKVEFLLNNVIHNLLDIIKPIYESNNVQINLSIKGDYRMIGYPNELGQAVLNILNNAKDALIDNNITNKLVSIEIMEVNQRVHLIISDNAGGIPDEIIENIFDPYFSTKDDKNGTGLGLYMTKMIIEEHMNGDITVSNGDNGAIFTIVLEQVKGKENV